MGKLVTGYDITPDGIRVWADIPKRRNGEHNDAALGRILLALNELPSPDAFDPPEPPKTEPPVIPHALAAAALRDGVLGGHDADDDEVVIPGFRCANGVCAGD